MTHFRTYSVGIVGPRGRMGQRCLHLLPDFPSLTLGAVLLRDATNYTPPHATTAVFGSSAMAAFVQQVDVVLDFAAPALIAELAPLAAAARKGYVVGSTGLSDVQQAALQEAAQQTQVFYAANFSRGVAVLKQLVAKASRELPGSEIGVWDLHHRHKRDAPSGTALALGEASGRPEAPAYSALRGGDVLGEHTVFFFSEGERLELRHVCTDRDVFARGALQAAAWLPQRAPGLYGMTDLLAAP